MEKIILYSTHCPKCNILESELIKKHIDFMKITDLNAMLKMEFTTAPMLEVDGELMDYTEAVKWITEDN